jgi:hypothetical protein
MDNGDLKLEWDPPDVEEVVQKYLILVSSDRDSATVTYDTNETMYAFADVSQCTTYTFFVTANVVADYSLEGVSLSVRTRDAGKASSLQTPTTVPSHYRKAI